MEDNQAQEGMSIDLANVPDNNSSLNEAQQAFTKYIPNIDATPQFQELAKADNPFEQLASLALKPTQEISLPTKDSSPEEWRALWSKLGAPEKIDDYAYTPPEVPEELKGIVELDNNMVNAFKQIAYDNGLTGKQWESIVEAYKQSNLESAKTFYELNQKQTKEFVDGFNKKFGTQANDVLGSFKNTISNYVDPGEKEILDGLSAAQLTALASAFHKFQTKEMKEDVISSRASQPLEISDLEYVSKLSNLYAEKNKLEAAGKYNTNEYRQAKDAIANFEKQYEGKIKIGSLTGS